MKAPQNQLTFLSEAPRASRSASPEDEQDWMTRVVTWPSSLFSLLADSAPVGWSGRTCPEFYPSMEEMRSRRSSLSWSKQGMASTGECSTLDGLEFPRWRGGLAALRGARQLDGGACDAVDWSASRCRRANRPRCSVKSYTCACGIEHRFDVWALAHLHETLVHACTCGRKNTIRRGIVIGAKAPRTKPVRQIGRRE